MRSWSVHTKMFKGSQFIRNLLGFIKLNAILSLQELQSKEGEFLILSFLFEAKTLENFLKLFARSHNSQGVDYVHHIIYAQCLIQTSLSFTQIRTHSFSLSSFSSFVSKVFTFREKSMKIEHTINIGTGKTFNIVLL